MQEMNGGLRMVNLGIVQPCGENKENGGDGENEKRRGRTRRSGENEKDYSFRCKLVDVFQFSRIV